MIIFKIQGLFKDPPKFSLKFKDFSRISRIDMKLKDFNDFFKDMATVTMYRVNFNHSFDKTCGKANSFHSHEVSVNLC